MTLKALIQGFGRLLRSPLAIVGLYLAGLALSLPLAYAMQQLLQDSLGDSLVSRNLVEGFDMGWYGELSYRSSEGLATTFGPWVVGILPVVGHLERLLDGELLAIHPTVLGAGVGWLLLWAFLTGGLVDRYAQGGAASKARFFAQCGEYFPRFLRLLGLSVLLYLGLFKWVSEPLHRWLGEASRDMTEERLFLLWTLAIYALVGFLLVVLKLTLDYAKVSMVLKTRRSAVLALVDGLRFVATYPGKTLGLFAYLTAVAGILMLLYNQVAPGPDQNSLATVLAAFLTSQLYLALRLALKLWFLASQTSLYQALPSKSTRPALEETGV